MMPFHIEFWVLIHLRLEMNRRQHSNGKQCFVTYELHLCQLIVLLLIIHTCGSVMMLLIGPMMEAHWILNSIYLLSICLNGLLALLVFFDSLFPILIGRFWDLSRCVFVGCTNQEMLPCLFHKHDATILIVLIDSLMLLYSYCLSHCVWPALCCCLGY
jgi:hypothetical protein